MVAAPETSDLPVAPAAEATPVDQPVTPPPAVFDGPPAATVAPPAPLQSPFAGVVPTGGTWAVVIGINDYPGTSHDLRWAGADADDTVAALGTLGVPGDHIVSLRDGGAPAATINRAADWLVAHASPDAVAVFFYAGHVRKLSAQTEAMIGSDGGTVTDADLAHHLSGLRARRTWLVMASCYGGGFDEALGPGRVLTAAADADHLAYETSDFDRSYLGEFMIREALLQGKANASVQSAFSYAVTQIHQRYPGREPVSSGDTGDVLDLRPPAGAAPPQRSSGAPSSGSSPGSPPPTSPPPKPPPSTTTTTDGCSSATFGVVRCG
jgi:hypothetical protein